MIIFMFRVFGESLPWSQSCRGWIGGSGFLLGPEKSKILIYHFLHTAAGLRSGDRRLPRTCWDAHPLSPLVDFGCGAGAKSCWRIRAAESPWRERFPVDGRADRGAQKSPNKTGGQNQQMRWSAEFKFLSVYLYGTNSQHISKHFTRK